MFHSGFRLDVIVQLYILGLVLIELRLSPRLALALLPGQADCASIGAGSHLGTLLQNMELPCPGDLESRCGCGLA